MAETHKGFGLLFEMGCGKTLTAIMIAGTAYQMGKVEKVLVVAPTSVCSVWPKDFAEFADLIQKEHSIAYRVTKDEALDLPEQTFLQRYITMSAKEKNIYDRIKRESFAELESGGQISATTVLTKLLRLQQFTGGF